MNSPVTDLNALRARILAGEHPDPSELRAAIEQLRSSRTEKVEKATASRKAAGKLSDDEVMADLDKALGL